MKKSLMLVMAALVACLSACAPPRVDPLETIQPNETAYVLPLEGENMDAQEKFESVQYLDQKKVASKRIVVPQRYRKVGRMWWEAEWVPTVMVVKVDRSPVTLEWTTENPRSEPISVESKDSIGFKVGVNITAHIDEMDTSKYLYRYRAQALSQVMSTNIRGEIQNILSEQFGQLPLEECKSKKSEIFETVRSRVIPKFKETGITISSLGLAEGLTFEDKEIQDAINAAYVAEMNIKRQDQERLAQLQVNDRLLSIAENERKQAEEFAKAAEARQKQVQVEVEKMKAEALLNFSQKWNGAVPGFLTVGEGSPFLFNVPTAQQ